jgi:hypothetical protein
MGVTPHNGRHLASYNERGVGAVPEVLRASDEFKLARDTGNTAALNDLKTEVSILRDAARAALANGHLFTSVAQVFPLIAGRQSPQLA